MTNTTELQAEIIGTAIAKRRGYDSIEQFNHLMDDEGETLYELFLDAKAAIAAMQVREMTVEEAKRLIYNVMTNDHFSVNATDIAKALAKLGTIRIVEDKNG